MERAEGGLPHPSRPAARISAAHPITLLLGLYQLAVMVFLSYVLLRLWPHVAGDYAAAEGRPPEVTILSIPFVGSFQLVGLAMAMGGLGSYLHVARSFIVFVGNGQLSARWFWWYLLWPPIGVALAAITCFVVQAGFMSGSAAGSVNPYGIAAISALVGMFAKPATEKLREVFETLFTVRDPAPLTDKLSDDRPNPRPERIAVEPTEVEPWRGAREITVRGRGFVTGCEVLVQGSPRRTDFVGGEELRVHLLPQDTLAEATLEISVRNPPSGGGVSEHVPLRVRRRDGGGGGAAPTP